MLFQQLESLLQEEGGTEGTYVIVRALLRLMWDNGGHQLDSRASYMLQKLVQPRNSALEKSVVRVKAERDIKLWKPHHLCVVVGIQDGNRD